MRKTSLLSLLLCCVAFLWIPLTYSQNCTVTAIANPATICYGGTSIVTAQGYINGSNYNFDFNNSQLPSGWSTNGVNFFSSPCGPSPSNTPYYWAGTSLGTPSITTNSLNVTSGGTVVFEMKYAVQGGPTPCEGPDLAHEGVSFQYSINGGMNWVDITYFSPGGYQLVSNPQTTNTVATGPTAYTVWATYSIPIPAAAQTTNTLFRWIQFNSSGGCCDNWGLDNIQVNAGAPVNYSWSNGVSGSNITSQTFMNLTQDTCIVVSVSDTLGNICSDTVCIIVIPVVDPNLVFPNPACAGAVQMDASTSIPPPAQVTQYIYDIGNNGTLDVISTQPISNYNFSVPGTYSVMLYITTLANCQGQELFSVDVYPKPTLAATFSPQPVCAGNPVTLLDNATVNNPQGFNNYITTVSWDINNDQVFDYTNPSNATQHTFPTAYNYVVTATATTDVGCTASQQIVVFIRANPTADFNFSNLCEGDITAFTDASTANGYPLTQWAWDFNDGNNAQVQNASNAYIAPGQYNVQLIVGATGGCIDTIVKPVTIHPKPVADIVLPTNCGLTGIFQDSTNILSGNINTWNWTFGDGNNSQSQDPSHTFRCSFLTVFIVQMLVK